jgi:hypothetical protein
MGLIGATIFAVSMLILGLIATISPSGIMRFYERLGSRSRLDETTTRWSIRSAGMIALLMAALIFWAILHEGIR